MDVRIAPILPSQSSLFFNLFQLYLHDLSAFTGEEPGEDGRFDLANTSLYLEREELHPYFIYCSGKVAGFILVCAPPFVPEEIDFTVQEMFVLHKYRGGKTAETAVFEIMRRLKGQIRVEQLQNNAVAVAFWKKIYRKQGISFVETIERVEIEGLPGLHEVLAQTFSL
ncbi:GNAT family N-acetyltransferase [Paenibacillus barengoltzii]|jgi:predicted acetyltransferase|uniref:GNAT family N-acetyltransferase n=1 Tax=Paenibacillus barengoltzii TaxID=343517 RepID=UPI00387A7B6B